MLIIHELDRFKSVITIKKKGRVGALATIPQSSGRATEAFPANSVDPLRSHTAVSRLFPPWVLLEGGEDGRERGAEQWQRTAVRPLQRGFACLTPSTAPIHRHCEALLTGAVRRGWRLGTS